MADMEEEQTPKICLGPSVSTHSRTYIFDGEDHTIGNSLRYVVMRKYVLVSLECNPVRRAQACVLCVYLRACVCVYVCVCCVCIL